MLRASLIAALLLLTPFPAHAGEGCWDTAWRCQDITDYRGAPLDQSRELQDDAKAWALHMARTETLAHSEISVGGEIVGRSTDWASMMAAWDGSSCVAGTWPTCPGHRELLLDRDFTHVGIGCSRSDAGDLYCSVRFA